VTLAAQGEACERDMDCHDRLICGRATARCEPPPVAVEWGSDFRNLHGTCLVDDDCPRGQVCELGYTTVAEGDYSPPYFVERDAGKHLCVPTAGATAASLCPRTGTTADLVGGRYVPGKEVCIRAETWLVVAAEDRDTHLQATVEEPLPYPAADAQYWLFGATTENVPPYKDPSRPQGAIADPAEGDHFIAIGTIRWDDSHGWWEMHPVKAYFPVSQGKGVADLQRRYRTHPGAMDAERFEEWEKSWGIDEKVRARQLEQAAPPR
jgi:hypothetical protein